jgi:long-subunit fatty acid transport protein
MISFTPTVAYKANDWLSIGAGPTLSGADSNNLGYQQ